MSQRQAFLTVAKLEILPEWSVPSLRSNPQMCTMTKGIKTRRELIYLNLGRNQTWTVWITWWWVLALLCHCRMMLSLGPFSFLLQNLHITRGMLLELIFSRDVSLCSLFILSSVCICLNPIRVSDEAATRKPLSMWASGAYCPHTWS